MHTAAYNRWMNIRPIQPPPYTRGATLPAEGRAHEGPLALVELHNGAASTPSHVAGTRNFWAVTRYNWSSYYALAVIDLGAAVAERINGRGAGPRDLSTAR